MTRTDSRTGRPAVRRTVLLLAAVVVASAASTVIALSARAAGADGFAALQPLVYLPFVVIGVLAATGGWAVVRSLAPRPTALLRILVPVLTALSLTPDIALGIVRFIPGTTWVGVVALMMMHLTVVGVTVPVLVRALRLPADRSRTASQRRTRVGSGAAA